VPLIFLPILVFGSIVFMVLAMLAPQESEIEARLRTYGAAPRAPTLGTSFSRRVLIPLLHNVAGLFRAFAPATIEERLQQRLAQAGNPYGMDATTFLATRGIAAVGLPILAEGVSILQGHLEPKTLAIMLGLGFLGWRLPDFWLNARVNARKRLIERALPDALDLIIVCVEAGNSLEAALAIVSQKLTGPLPEEIGRTLREVSLGKGRRDALRDLATRTGAPDLQSFIAAVLQADQLGVGIAQVLRVQGDAMRIRRRQRAEEAAAKVPVKMLIPLVVFIFPTIMIVIVGPVGITILTFFKGAH
jgi:tight adherence protein C